MRWPWPPRRRRPGGRCTTRPARVLAAEEREEKLRDELLNAGDAAELRRLIDAHGERAQLVDEAGSIAEMLSAATAEHEKSAAALSRRDGGGRPGNRAGPCGRDRGRGRPDGRSRGDAAPAPGCRCSVPGVRAGRGQRARDAAGAASRRRQCDVGPRQGGTPQAAANDVKTRDRAARDLDRQLAAVEAHRDQLAARMTDLDGRLADAPGPATLRDELRAIAALQRQVEDATAGVRSAREANRRAVADAKRAEERVQAAWRTFDGARDGVAAFGPPPADRSDLAVAWATLTDWAAGQSASRAGRRDDVVATVQTDERVGRRVRVGDRRAVRGGRDRLGGRGRPRTGRDRRGRTGARGPCPARGTAGAGGSVAGGAGRSRARRSGCPSPGPAPAREQLRALAAGRGARHARRRRFADPA